MSTTWKLALAVAVFLVQQQLENHLRVPKLMERQLGINPVTVIIALLVGSAPLGIVGALLAIPIAAIVQVVVDEVPRDPQREGEQHAAEKAPAFPPAALTRGARWICHSST